MLINANVYAKGTTHLAKLPDIVSYAGVGSKFRILSINHIELSGFKKVVDLIQVSFLRFIPLRLWANVLAFNGISPATYDQTNVCRRRFSCSNCVIN